MAVEYYNTDTNILIYIYIHILSKLELLECIIPKRYSPQINAFNLQKNREGSPLGSHSTWICIKLHASKKNWMYKTKPRPRPLNADVPLTMVRFFFSTTGSNLRQAPSPKRPNKDPVRNWMTKGLHALILRRGQYINQIRSNTPKLVMNPTTTPTSHLPPSPRSQWMVRSFPWWPFKLVLMETQIGGE